MSSKTAEDIYNDLMALNNRNKLDAVVISTAGLILSVDPEKREQLAGLIFGMVTDLVNKARVENEQIVNDSLH